MSREEFFTRFQAWAGEQVKAWGLDPQPPLDQLLDELRWSDPELAVAMAASQKARLDALVARMAEQVGRPAMPGEGRLTADRWPEMVRPPVEIDDDQLMEWRRAHPDHPDLLAEEIRRRIDARGAPVESLIPMLERLAALRPVDAFAHRKLAQIYLASQDRARAIPHLEALDVREEKTPVYARELATLYREAGDIDAAMSKVARAVSIDPYDASHRELAAAIAVEAKRLDLARLHVKALTLLEPDRPQHQKRLDRLDAMIGAGG
jgi:tetratricopeptide (TPR) repeat protein